MKHYTQAQVLEAVNKSNGIVRNVSKLLSCDWTTANRYINKWDKTKEAFNQFIEINLDVAEDTVLTSIQKGDVQTAKWYLTLKGKERGYTEESINNNNNNNTPAQVVIELNDRKPQYTCGDMMRLKEAYPGKTDKELEELFYKGF